MNAVPHEPADHKPRVLVIACGALVRELRSIISANEWTHLDVAYLPAPLHNRPDRIVPAIRGVLEERAGSYDRVVLGYADCGTGGLLDQEIESIRTTTGLSVERLPGNHCYEFFAGTDEFEALHEEELGTLFLTDYLARHFDLLIWQGMGLADHPELLPMYFGNYRRVVLLSQTTDPDALAPILDFGRAAAKRLGLDFEHRPTGLDPFSLALTSTNVHLSGAC